eukprot:TRINITY_DN3700_c0_g1_i4.p1 TRINITY_DN3700_c0_g1~~TRINITY_DN3700_c0_g1_i4.p1  ORF type:complete len:103 (+),score=31.59 TRINITY_DN3700_c0_g1_i4:131-439(+)
MIRRPPRSTLSSSSAASDVYKRQVQDSSTNQLIFKTEYLIHWVSKFMTLSVGDIILTGTPPGVGCFRKPPLWLKPGDVVKCEIEGIGAIENRVAQSLSPSKL